jgi:hypothetical protein
LVNNRASDALSPGPAPTISAVFMVISGLLKWGQ